MEVIVDTSFSSPTLLKPFFLSGMEEGGGLNLKRANISYDTIEGVFLTDDVRYFDISAYF